MVLGAESLKGGYCQPAVREAWARMVQEKGSEVDRLNIHWRKNRQEMAMDYIRKIRKGCGFNLSNCVGIGTRLPRWEAISVLDTLSDKP